MKVTVLIPLNCYDSLMGGLDRSSSEYRALRNCTLTRDEYGEVAETFCELDQAEKILRLARQFNSGRATSIAQNVRIKRDA